MQVPFKLGFGVNDRHMKCATLALEFVENAVLLRYIILKYE